MSSAKIPETNRWEAAALLVGMAVATAWYAWPQLVYSLVPVIEIWRSLLR